MARTRISRLDAGGAVIKLGNLDGVICEPGCGLRYRRLKGWRSALNMHTSQGDHELIGAVRGLAAHAFRQGNRPISAGV